MRLQHVGVIVVMLAGAASLALYRMPARPQPPAAAPPGKTLHLNGVLEPVASTPIEASILTLSVPVNSRVRKGEVVGISDARSEDDQPESVSAPADGILVPADLTEGRFGIAETATPLLNVVTLVPENELQAVHAGQHAVLLTTDGTHTQLSATVRDVASVPVTSANGAVSYPIALTAENPGKAWFTGVGVDIQLAATSGGSH